jgi:hypothetical protein
MNGFLQFVRPLLEQGHALLRERPRITPADLPSVASFLAAAHAGARLDVAGPLLPFDEPAALAAAECVWWACWFLVNRNEPADDVERVLKLPLPPRSAAAHLSGDLLLRFLPAIHRRARALAPDDLLTRWCENLLRQWPLSGVLADIGEAPTTTLDFAGHPGLLLLYAERLADHLRPAWVPSGPGCQQVELVFAERGLRVPVMSDEYTQKKDT